MDVAGDRVSAALTATDPDIAALQPNQHDPPAPAC